MPLRPLRPVRARLRDPQGLIATTPAVAAWAREPIETFQPGCGFAPLVIGPDDVPRITDPTAAAAAPELAVLSAVMHGDDEGGAVATAALDAARTLEDERRQVYCDLILGSLSDVARAIVEAIMRDRGYEPLTEVGREMLRQGRVEGRVEGMRAMVAATCGALGIPWTAEHERAIEALDENALVSLHEQIVRTRAWPSH